MTRKTTRMFTAALVLAATSLLGVPQQAHAGEGMSSTDNARTAETPRREDDRDKR